MKKEVLVMMRYINRFGIYRGLILFMKISSKGTKRINVPGIKHPIYFRGGTSDAASFRQIYLWQGYNFPTKISPEVIIDGGANIGLSAIYFRHKFANAKMIIAVEPDSDNFRLMKKNTSSYKNIHAIHSGLWNKEIAANVTNKYDMGAWGMRVEEGSSGTEEVITTVTIDKIMERFGLKKIDLLKLDIETAEKHLFKDNYSNWLPKVKMIVIELHDHFEKGCSKPFFEAINTTFNNYSLETYSENVIIVNEDL